MPLQFILYIQVSGLTFVKLFHESCKKKEASDYGKCDVFSSPIINLKIEGVTSW
jgi:hypothetical protein